MAKFIDILLDHLDVENRSVAEHLIVTGSAKVDGEPVRDPDKELLDAVVSIGSRRSVKFVEGLPDRELQELPVANLPKADGDHCAVKLDNYKRGIRCSLGTQGCITRH